jgi:hypothetical protein
VKGRSSLKKSSNFIRQIPLVSQSVIDLKKLCHAFRGQTFEISAKATSSIDG